MTEMKDLNNGFKSLESNIQNLGYWHTKNNSVEGSRTHRM